VGGGEKDLSFSFFVTFPSLTTQGYRETTDNPGTTVEQWRRKRRGGRRGRGRKVPSQRTEFLATKACVLWKKTLNTHAESHRVL